MAHFTRFVSFEDKFNTRYDEAENKKYTYFFF
jgi:hypothetical protein